ncbi:hypothetical protein SSTU70S_04299 [Stutzerimonas stutzeri]
MAMDSDYVKQMSTQLANYEVQSSLDRLNRNESNYKTQRDALSQLRTSLTTFKSALTKLNSSTSSMLVNSATYSQDGYATATVGTTAQPGSYQFYVEQLASKQQVAVQGLTDGSLSGTLTLNAQTFDLSGYATLDDAAKAINDAGLGVQATLVRSNGQVNLVLTSEESGAANAFTFGLTGGATSTTLSTAQDARIRMGGSFGSGGIELTSASNTFDNVIDEARWGEQMLQALRDNVELQLQQKIQSATIRLDPPELGALDIHLSHESGRLHVQLTAAHADVARLLQQTSDRLRQELVGQNFVQVNVQVGADAQGQQGRGQPRAPLAEDQSLPAANAQQPASQTRGRERAADVLVTV